MFKSASPLLTRQNVEVLAQGEKVILKIGNTPITMCYLQAIDLSIWMRDAARAAKQLAEDEGRSLRSLGTLDALPHRRDYGAVSGTAIHVKEKKQAWRPEDVWITGQLVCVRIGRRTFKLHYAPSLKLAQWLRVRGKEAARTAGDTRHWTELAT